MWVIMGVGVLVFFLALSSFFSTPGGGLQAQQGAARLDIHNMSEGIETFKQINGRYPTTAEGLSALVRMPAGENLPNWRQVFDRMPLDPWGHPYIYTAPTSPSQSFKILSYGPDGKPGGGDDISN